MVTNKIDADDKTLKDILDTQKYSIDYFQREYRWERKHIEQLIVDLEASFFSNYKPEHERADVEYYNSYFLGPIVICNKDDHLSIIDGQQRLTSLTLLLIYIHNLQNEKTNHEPVESLIRSTKFGKHSYNLKIQERIKCLDALYKTGEYDATGIDESVNNLIERFEDIKEFFPKELKGEALPFFIDWLKEKIIFVKIAAYSDENAYTIFETMNDRGLNLTPTEMLKGYLLSKVSNELKTELNDLWKKKIGKLHEYDKFEDLEFFRAWLRAKYADTIRPGKKGAANEDFEKIGTSFHGWVKEKLELIGLNKKDDFSNFIKTNFDFYSKLYLKIIDAENKFKKELEYIYYIGYFGIAYSLSYPLLMSPIKVSDTEETVNKKLNIVARFIETFTIYRAVNYRTLAQSSIRYTLYTLVKEIRDKTASELITIFKMKIKEYNENLSGMVSFGLHQQNKRFLRYLLARITNYIERESGIPSSFEQYINDSIKKPYQIEHIWSDIFEKHKDKFDQRDDFFTYRNKIGGLILLPEGTNQSFNKDPYEKKLPHYLKENLLAQSLHEDCYKKNPNFLTFKNNSGICFKPHKEFKKQDLIERSELYKEICESIWSLDGFDNLLNVETMKSV
ncbi:MAG: DUF262 domain-containing protein [Epsilonproteobacteria bacterium]|nr:DUF262 domain-containing protein [Campylobacterota bacterium]